VRVGLLENGDYLINPTFQQLEESRLNLVVAGSDEAVVMVEAGAHEVSESDVLEGIFRARVEQEINRQKDDLRDKLLDRLLGGSEPTPEGEPGDEPAEGTPDEPVEEEAPEDVLKRELIKKLFEN